MYYWLIIANFFKYGILLQQPIAPLEGVSAYFSYMFCAIRKEVRGQETFDLPGKMSQQLLDPFSSDSIVQQKWRCFQDFVGVQKIEYLSESNFFAEVFQITGRFVFARKKLGLGALGFKLVSISVSFCLELMLGTLSSLCGAICFKIYSSTWRSITVFGAGRKTTYVYSQWQSWALVLLLLNYREHGIMYLLDMAMNLLLCGFHLFMFCWTWYHTNLEQMLEKECQFENIRQNGHNVGHFLLRRSSAWRRSLSLFRNCN